MNTLRGMWKGETPSPRRWTRTIPSVDCQPVDAAERCLILSNVVSVEGTRGTLLDHHDRRDCTRAGWNNHYASVDSDQYRASAPARPSHMSFWSSLLDIMGMAARALGYGAGISFLVLSLLSPRSQRARLYLNVLLYITSMGMCSVFGVVSSPILKLVGQATNINYCIARTFHLLAGNLTGLRFKVEGAEKIDKAKPAVVIGNHQTGVDILYLGAVFPKQASIMAKQELKFAPLLGQFMWLSGAVFINRADRKNAVQAFDRVAKKMKKLTMSLWIFPEGTRSNLPFPDLLPFKKGAFHLAVQAQVPIVPVVCENYNRFFDGKTRFEAVLDPVDTTGLTANDVTDLTARIRQTMLNELQQMDADLDRADAAAQHAGTKPRSTLGGVTKLASYIVGEGQENKAVKRAMSQRQQYSKKGMTGRDASDYGLVNETSRGAEGQDAKSSAVAAGSALAGEASRRSTTATGQGDVSPESNKAPSHSSDETDEGAVFVKRP